LSLYYLELGVLKDTLLRYNSTNLINFLQKGKKLSIKDELQYVKEELNSDEKLLESAFKLERIYKKHKIKIWAILVILIGGFGTSASIKAYKEHKLNSANEAYLKLQTSPDDKEALKQLKENNPKLYNLYIYSQAISKKDEKILQELSKVDDKLLLDLTKYHLNILKNRAGESKYYKDLSIIEKAYENIKAGKKAKARELLSMIDVKSPLLNIANLLKHLVLE
jgi:hypothetical protein